MTGATLTRRSVLGFAGAQLLPAAALAAPARSAALPVPKSDHLVFDVYRNGSRIGQHKVSFHRDGPALRVESHLELHVSVVGIRLFHYKGRFVEHWHDGTFRSATSDIDDDGTKHVVNVKRVAQGVAISGNHIKSYVAPADALPLTYWNKQVLSGPMINLLTGHTDRPTVTKKGWFKWPAVPSGDVIAREYKLTGSLKLAVYYDRAGTWSGLSFHHRGHITYRPVLDAS